MKKLLLMASAAVLCTAMVAQTKPDSLKYWKVGGLSSLTFNQVALTNWAAGGKNSVAGTFLLNSHFNYKKEKVAWDNNFDFGFGLTRQGTENPVKTEDKLQFASKYGYAASKYWYYTGLVDFKTQMAQGFKNPPTNSIKLSEFMAPAYLTASLGMDFKRSDNFSMYISPVTCKMTMVLQDSLSQAGAYGVKPGESIRSEYGAYIKTVAQKKELVKNVDLFTKLELFSNLADNPQNVDVNWEILFNLKVNKFLSAMASWTMIYDDDTKYTSDTGEVGGARLQMKQLFGFGLSYTFGQ